MGARADVVGELIEVLDRFTEISELAVRACELPDVSAIERALDARDVVLARARDLAPVLQNGPLPAAVRQRLEQLERADRQLNEALERARDATRRDLGDVGANLARVGGYASAVPRLRNVDVRR